MATDPFGDIKKPVCGGSIEIGQATFVELISAEEQDFRLWYENCLQCQS